MTTSAFPYAHPRRPEGPLQPGDRVRRYAGNGGHVFYATVLTGPVRSFSSIEDKVLVRWDGYDDSYHPGDELVPASTVERFGRTPAAFRPR